MRMSENIFNDVTEPQAWKLDISSLNKGIDNYHVDVRLSKRFSSDLKILITELIRRETDQKQYKGDADKAFSPLCKSYLDMMTVLIHRVKTDLSAEQVCFLQFAIPKFILDSVTAALNSEITATKKQAADLRNQGSMHVLKVQHQIALMSKHYNSIVYRVKKQIFEHLHRVEYRQLRVIREQYLGASEIDYQDFLSNVLMLNRDLNSAQFLIEHYINWGGDLEESEFPVVNSSVEELLQKELPELETRNLKVNAENVKDGLEVYDDLRGLRAIQYYLGPAINMREQVIEDFCWFDSPHRIKTLFDIDSLRENISDIKQKYDARAVRAYKGQIKRLEKFLKLLARLFKKKKYLKHFLASYEAKKYGERSLTKNWIQNSCVNIWQANAHLSDFRILL